MNWFAGKRHDKAKVIRLLQTIAKERKAFRLEVENTTYVFYSFLSLKPDMLVFSKPKNLAQKALKVGQIVRFTTPDSSAQSIRAEILNPHLQRKLGDNVFTCNIPSSFASRTRRINRRFSTMRFNNLFLYLVESDSFFRIVDMSITGCKVFIKDAKLWGKIPPSSTHVQAKIQIGEKLEIDLEKIRIRYVGKNFVSFEWRLDPSSTTGKYIGRFLEVLNQTEIKELGTPTTEETSPKNEESNKPPSQPV